MSRLGSQFKSFIVNASPTEHASCRTAPKPRLFSIFTRPYPNLPEFPLPIPPVSPQWGASNPPCDARRHLTSATALPINIRARRPQFTLRAPRSEATNGDARRPADGTETKPERWMFTRRRVGRHRAQRVVSRRRPSGTASRPARRTPGRNR